MRGRKRPWRIEAAGGHIVKVDQCRDARTRSGEPQAPQKCRFTFGEDWYSTRRAARETKLATLAKVTHATTGDAADRRHDWQWQTMLFAGFAVAEYRTAPHMQPP